MERESTEKLQGMGDADAPLDDSSRTILPTRKLSSSSDRRKRAERCCRVKKCDCVGEGTENRCGALENNNAEDPCVSGDHENGCQDACESLKNNTGVPTSDYLSVPILRFIYALGSILWILLCAYIAFTFEILSITALLALLPLIVFGIAIYEAPRLTREVESSLFLGNFLYFASIAAILMMHKTPRKVVVFTFLAAIFLLAISLIDLWVESTLIVYFKHVRSMLQTTGVTMLILAMIVLFAGLGSSEVWPAWETHWIENHPRKAESRDGFYESPVQIQHTD